MFIEQIIEFQLRRPPGGTCISIAGYFHDKTKTLKNNLRSDYHLLLKYCETQRNLFLSTWAKSLTKFNPKRQDFNRVLNLNCKEEDETI